MFKILRKYVTAYRNKITNKLLGVVFLRSGKIKKGTVLLSFITGPFTLAPGEYFTDPHPNYWAVTEIVRIFLERGYDVDAIEWNNFKFIPKKKYIVCIDMQYNLERLSKYLPANCIKIMHLVASYPEYQNKVENERIKALEKRRGVIIQPRRTDPLTSNPGIADFIGGYGNKTVHGTFASFGKKIEKIPVPAMDTYDFPENKNFEISKGNFLWFGGGGAILKGLDLVVEAFATLPHLNLIIIGPASYEKEFEEIYKKELNLPNIKRYSRPKITKSGKIMVDGKDISEIFNQCGAIVYMSASEGGGGATVHAMQAGLFPIVTPNTGIYEEAPSIIVNNPTVENIKNAVLEFSKLPAEKIKEMSKDVWIFARENYTREIFTKKYENFIDNIIKLK